MNNLWQDISYGIRKLRRQPGFTLVSVLTLALGIGMNAAIFSIVYAILLRPLPAPDADRLMAVSSTVHRESLERRAVSYKDFQYWNEQNQSFDLMAVQSGGTFTWQSGNGAIRLEAELVSSGYFPLLGGKPLKGRVFNGEDDRRALPLAVVSYEFWKNRTGMKADLVGTTLRLDEQSVEVIGILSQDFFGLGDETEIWVPVSSLGAFGSGNLVDERGNRWLNVFARRKSNTSVEQARLNMEAVVQQLAKDFPDTNQQYGVMLIPFRDELLGDTQSAALVLFGAVAFVLLIACTNVANLMLVRTSARRKELAVRTALGASRIRMMRQLITESMLLSIGGGISGILLAVWCLALIKRFSPVTLPGSVPIHMDSTVFIFTFAMTTLAGIAIGLITTLRLNGSGPQDALKEAAASTSHSRSGKRMRNILVSAETAFAFMLLIGAGLMIRSFSEIQSIRPGFQKERLLTMNLSLPASKYEAEKGHAFRRLLLERIQALPSVQSASLTSDLPWETVRAQQLLLLKEDSRKRVCASIYTK